MTDISVVVATRNRPADLSACLSSLLDQSRPAAAIVVVVDAPGGRVSPYAGGRAPPRCPVP
jgi:GT2 family glycosyltransferase